ncbi:MAG: hypothetical protein IJ689_05515 [Alphaproteobacteria bacterium]|nr:hypothetical protein [Alphaproteobacteria bacterium]
MSKEVSNDKNELEEVNLPESEEHDSWLSNNLHRLMIIISVFWFAIVLIYITQFFGWSNLFLMMPDEFGVFLAGISLPLPIIWLVMSFIDRERSFKQEAKFLRAYMNQLVYPEEGSADTAKAMADAIRSQVVELQEVTKLAMDQTQTIKHELGGRVDDFANLVQVLDNYSTKSIVELTNGVKTLTQSFDGVTDRAFQTTKELNQCMSEFSQVAEHLQNDIGGIIKQLIPGVQEMKNSADTIQSVAETSTQRILEANENLKNYSAISEENFNQVIDKLQNQGQYLEDISEKAITSSQNVGEKVKAITLDIDEILKSQTLRVNEYAQSLDENIREVYKKFAEHGEALGGEVDKIITRSNVIEESISIQVNELKNVAEDITSTLNGIDTNLSAQLDNLGSHSQSAVSELERVVGAFENSAEKLHTAADSAAQQAISCGDGVEFQHDRVQQLTDHVFENLNGITTKVDENLARVKISTNEIIEQFNTLSNALNLQTDKLSEASNFAVTQSKVAETSLLQQNKHINNSIATIEETKNELKRQIDELSHAAEVISGEASVAVDNLKEQLAASVKVSSDVVERTNEINKNLKQGAEDFADITGKTLAKVVDLEEVISKQNTRFGKLIGNVDEKTSQISEVLEQHAAMVEKAAANSGDTFNEILSSFESQSTLLNSVAENTVGYVSDVVQALDEKAENINLLFKHQQSEFLDVCNKISAHTDNLSSSLKNQIAAIEESSDKVFAKMADMEENIGKHANEVAEKSNLSIDRLGEVDREIEARSQKLENNINDIFAKMSKTAGEFTLTLNSFGGLLKDMKTNTDATTSAILISADKLKTANNGFNNDVKDFVGQIDAHLHVLDDTSAKLQEQALSLENNFNRHKGILADAANSVAAQTRLGESSMAKQQQYMQDIVVEVEARMKEITEKLNGDMEGLYEKAGKLSYEVNALGDRVLKVGDEIGKSTQNSIKNIEKVHLSMEQCSEDLITSADTATAKMGQVMKDYEQYLSGFNTVTSEASVGVNEVNEMIAAQNDKMIHISQDTKALVDYFNALLKDAADNLTEKANFAHDKIQGLGDDLKSLGLQLEDAAGLSSKYFEKSGDKLRSTIMEITANAERISSDIKNSSEVFMQQSETLRTNTDETLHKVNEVMSDIKGSIDDFNNKSSEIVASTGNFNGVLQKQIELLEIGAKKASKDLLEIEKKYREAKVDTFMKSAAGIIEKLENLAVDINGVFNAEAQERLWKKYYEGDTEAFVRHLSKNITRKQVLAIKEEFEKNPEFRKVVTSYMSEFEGLINKARACEKSGVLLSVISGADIGKIYYIIARALDKLN